MKDDCGLCKRYGRGCQYHPDVSQSVTSGDLSTSQVVAMECLTSRGLDETLADVAERAKVTRRTLHRYLRDEVFIAEFRKRIEDELGSARSKVAVALVRGASMPGPGQAAMQKIYWQRLGELVDRHEHSGPGGGPVITRIERVVVRPEDDDS